MIQSKDRNKNPRGLFQGITTHHNGNSDKAIILAADILRENIRKVDLVGRFNGGKYVVILPDTDLNEALIFSERLRNAIENTSAEYKDNKIQFTISLGVAEFNIKSEDPDNWLSEADSALHLAKELGRNQVRPYYH